MKIEEENNSIIGTIANRYTLIESKGKGLTANVYLAEDQTNKRKYALKVMKEISPSFQNEISILEKVSSLNNPYIINLISSG